MLRDERQQLGVEVGVYGVAALLEVVLVALGVYRAPVDAVLVCLALHNEVIKAFICPRV